MIVFLSFLEVIHSNDSTVATDYGGGGEPCRILLTMMRQPGPDQRLCRGLVAAQPAWRAGNMLVEPTDARHGSSWQGHQPQSGGITMVVLLGAQLPITSQAPPPETSNQAKTFNHRLQDVGNGS